MLECAGAEICAVEYELDVRTGRQQLGCIFQRALPGAIRARDQNRLADMLGEFGSRQ